MSPITRQSPLDGRDVQFFHRQERPPFGRFDLSQQELRDLYVGGEMEPVALHNSGYGGFSQEYIRAAWNLIRSKLWRTFRDQATPNLCVVKANEYERILRTTGHLVLREYVLLTFEQMVEEARNLTFTEKCLRTLENINVVWRNTKQPVEISYVRFEPENGFVIAPQSNPISGMAYGCDELEASGLYKWLMDEKLISGMSQNTDGLKCTGYFQIGPKGFIELDRLRKGAAANVKRAFLIRRYDPDLDVFLRPVLDEVEKRTKCEIRAVWEDHHNDKIDERILRLIKEASLVVLDIDATRFNVGFEAGYALALNKPIVTIREKPVADKFVPPPFDIATMNCYDYDRSNPQELIGVLSARIQNALEQAKLA